RRTSRRIFGGTQNIASSMAPTHVETSCLSVVIGFFPYDAAIQINSWPPTVSPSIGCEKVADAEQWRRQCTIRVLGRSYFLSGRLVMLNFTIKTVKTADLVPN